ncbi:DUF3265 domain-containing protein [Vibrio parahaemolyticus]|nr:DUF3265 domain-containing protein [Vibrio parahaemolyticus]ELA7176850.1 DUF3265 domain-containing protein [Vibrio parahaemolyticus]ELA7459339.1 DUF3265 domain-containing protein [Vibrio parahaemolyticus]ELA7483302.1 DUF3265 domain-containing protein [Vibrio parahaemolyticus]ELA7905842.1 DUF3265 domain-containing protein [Vibrio parahaemolyticus]
MHAAWHFWFAVSFGGESGVRKLGLGGIHPLTQRYKTRSRPSIIYSQGQLNTRTMLTIY